jgi:hypothetical protein
MKTKTSLAISLLVGLFVLPSAAVAQSLSTDQDAYCPGETVMISGEGFAPGDIAVVVLRPDGYTDTDVDVCLGTASGSFTAYYVVPNIGFDGTYFVTATDSSGASLTVPFYDPYKMNVSYEIISVGDPGSPSNPSIAYKGSAGQNKTQAITTTSTQLDGNVQTGSTWIVSLNPLDGSTDDERWYAHDYLYNSAPVSFTPSGDTIEGIAGGNISVPDVFVFRFYHQFCVFFNYTVAPSGDPGNPDPPEVTSLTQFGTATSATAGTTGVWVDSGSGYEYPDHLDGPAGSDAASERWVWDSVGSLTGTISAATELNPTYLHQYHLSISAAPETGGTVTPDPAGDEGWYTSGTSVTVTAAANSGYVFLGWTLDEDDTVGDDNPISIPMSAAHILVARFQEQEEDPEYVFCWLPPIDPDGTSVFKQKSTVPVKFRLSCDGESVTDAIANIHLYKGAPSTTNEVGEVASTAAATSGTQFRYDATDDLYIFNLNTKNLTAGFEYWVVVTMNDLELGDVKITLK